MEFLSLYEYMNNEVRDLDNGQLSSKRMQHFEITSFSIFIAVIVSWTEIVPEN